MENGLKWIIQKLLKYKFLTRKSTLKALELVTLDLFQHGNEGIRLVAVAIQDCHQFRWRRIDQGIAAVDLFF